MRTVEVRDRVERELVLGLLARMRMPWWRRVLRDFRGYIIVAFASFGGAASQSGGAWWWQLLWAIGPMTVALLLAERWLK